MEGKERVEKIIKELKKLFPETKIALNYNTWYELFIAVVLSAQTTDKQVNVVTNDLFEKYKSFDAYLKVPLEEFQNDVKRIGLYKGKARNIKAAFDIIHNKYNDVLPASMEKLIELPGVGRKTANVLLNNIYAVNEGIAVDTHVRRLSNLFGLSSQANPNKIEKDLMEIVPKKEWGEFTYRVIDYGRIYCTARCKHSDCPLRKLIV